MKPLNDPSRVFRMPEVLKLYGVSKPTLHRWIKRGTFPAPILLGGPGTRAKGWLGPTLTKHQQSLTAPNLGGADDEYVINLPTIKAMINDLQQCCVPSVQS